MRIFLILVFILITTYVFSQTGKETNTFKQIEIIVSDLNNDNKLDTIIISSSLKNSLSFNKISISISGFGEQIFKAQNSWTNVDSKFLTKNKNVIQSKKLFVNKTKSNSVILLFGNMGGAGYREDFTIINIKENNAIIAFDRKEKDIDIEFPIKLSDIDNNGRIDFLFRNMFEIYQEVDSLNADIGVYSPYLIYTIDNDFQLNKDLTKKYNEENYVFAGYEYSGKIKILYPRDKSKPKIWKGK